jgi:hypothetical protein
VAEFSNLLRQRLSSGAALWVQEEAHPDADTLTAYVERSLPALERNRVLGHLAGCSQCRDIVALTLVEPVEAMAVRVAAASSALPWWRQRWAPRLGLAASLATVAVIAAVVVELPRTGKQTPSDAKARLENHAVDSGSPASPGLQPSVPPPASLAEGDRAVRGNAAGLSAASRTGLRDQLSGNDRVSFARRASAGAKDMGAVTIPAQPVPIIRNSTIYAYEVSTLPASQQDYLNNQIFSMDGAANGAVQATDLPAAPAVKTANQFQLQNSMVNSRQFAFSNLPTQTQQNTKVLVIHKPPSRTHFPMVVLDQIPLGFRRAAPAIRPNVTFSSAMTAELNPLKEKSDIALGEVAATSSTADAYRGDLDRSSAFSPRAMSDKYEKKAETSAASWKVDGGRLLKFGDSGAWMEAYPRSEGVDFSVVRSHGLEIWAGGSHAALVHSRDGGATWERITLGASAAGTITAIEARGANILVKSSSGQSWSSPDGGKSWTLLE